MALFEFFSDNSSNIDKILSKFRNKLNYCNDWYKLIQLIAEVEVELKKIENVKKVQKYFAEKIAFDKVNVIQKIYTKEEGKFYERTINFEMDIDSLPKELKSKLNNLNEELNIDKIIEKDLAVISSSDNNLN